jgi:hypothetical protein
MGTSFVKYKGFGFWTRDTFLESWLSSLVHELGKLSSLERWQEVMTEHWRTQAGIDGGVMSVSLDEFLTDETREGFVLSLAKKALEHSDPLGHRTGELFIDLLVGDLKTTVSSPVDYLDDPGTSRAGSSGSGTAAQKEAEVDAQRKVPDPTNPKKQ